MSDTYNPLAQAHELLVQLRGGSGGAYLDLYRLMFANGLAPSDIEPGLTDPELRRLGREVVAKMARACLAGLEAGHAGSYVQLMGFLAMLAAKPEEVLRRSHDQLLELWRKAALANAQCCLEDPNDPSRGITVLDQLLWIDVGPETLRTSMAELRRL